MREGVTDQKKSREDLAREYAEGIEQATKREWSAYGDVRVESFLAGYEAERQAEKERLEAELFRYRLALTKIAGHCEHYNEIAELCDCSTFMAMVAEKALRSGEEGK